MPGGNRTGPMGMGPRTGRGAGYCSGFGAPGSANMTSGRGGGIGFGRGRGFSGGGRGLRNRFYATGTPGWMRYNADFGQPIGFGMPDPETEKQALKRQADALKAQMEHIHSRLEELDTKSAVE